MEYLNNDISDAALIRSLCQHNKRHIKEIDRLQSLNSQLEELVVELRTKLDTLEAVDEIFDTLVQDTQYTDKEMKAVVKKLDFIKIIRERSKNTKKKYARLKEDHDLLMERYAKLSLWRKERERGKE